MRNIFNQKRKKRLLIVCTGNICRSPTAEVVLRHKFEEAGLAHTVEIDSAGTMASIRQGAAPDPDAVSTAARRYYNLSGLKARQFELQDFHEFDYILAMDKENYNRLYYLKPTNARAELRLFLSFIPALKTTDVPDPYRRRMTAFERALDLIEMGAGAIVEALRKPETLR